MLSCEFQKKNKQPKKGKYSTTTTTTTTTTTKEYVHKVICLVVVLPDQVKQSERNKTYQKHIGWETSETE